MHNKLVDAIRNKKALSISYDGGTRTVEPHCYGIGRNGQPLLRCYQSSGYSSSGNPSDWKLMRVEKIESMSDAGHFFPGPRPGYNPHGDKAIPAVYAML